MAGDLWKPSGDPKGSGAGKLVFLSAQDHGSNLYIVDAKTGEALDVGKFQKKYEDGRYIYRFNKPGASFNDVVVIDDQGNHAYIPNGSQRHEGSMSWAQAKKNTSGKEGIPKYDPATFTLKVGDGVKVTDVPNSTDENGISNNLGVADTQLLTGANLSFNRTTFEFTDPVDTLRKLAAENRGQLTANYLEALQQAGQLSEANKNQLIDYLAAMSPLQMQMVGIENAFNQQQKLQAAETAQPGITDLLRGEVKNAQTLASGRLLRDSEDRALEQTARSAGADAAWTRGLGDDSLVGRRLSDQLSVSQRLGIMQQGQSYMSTAVQLANATLMDTPNKATLSQQIPGTPQRLFSDIVTQQQQEMNRYTTMSPEAAQSSIVGQRTKQADLDAALQSEYNKYMFDIEAANTQAINTHNQDVLNAQNSQAQTAAKSSLRQQLSHALQKGFITNQEYERALADLEATGHVDITSYVQGKKGWKKGQTWEEYWEEYQNSLRESKDREAKRKEEEEQRRRDELSVTNSDTLSGRSPQATSKEKSLPTTTTTPANTKVNGVTVRTSGNGKIYTKGGKIRLPQFSSNKLTNNYLEYLDNILADIDLEGVL